MSKKVLTFKKNQLHDYHYEGLLSLMKYYAKKLKTSHSQDSSIRKSIELKINYLSKISHEQFYTAHQQSLLNKMRDEYYNQGDFKKPTQ